MALTNAERQALWRDRRNNLAKQVLAKDRQIAELKAQLQEAQAKRNEPPPAPPPLRNDAAGKPHSRRRQRSLTDIKHDVKYCGQVIWPSAYLAHVAYEDLKAGWHLADHWLKHIEVATPQKPNEVLHAFGHLIQDIRAASSIQGLTDVMTTCMGAYGKRNQRRPKADFSDGMPPGLPR